MCAEYRSFCPCLSSAAGCTRCEVRCSVHGEGGRRALAVATVSQTTLTRMPTRDEHSAIPSNPQRSRRHSVGTRLRRTTSPRPMCLPRQAPRLLLASLRLPDRLACRGGNPTLLFAGSLPTHRAARGPLPGKGSVVTALAVPITCPCSAAFSLPPIDSSPS
jgi:hypothetical protein